MVRVPHPEWVLGETYPRLTLLGQAVGSVRLAFAALCQLRPEVVLSIQNFLCLSWQPCHGAAQRPMFHRQSRRHPLADMYCCCARQAEWDCCSAQQVWVHVLIWQPQVTKQVALALSVPPAISLLHEELMILECFRAAGCTGWAELSSNDSKLTRADFHRHERLGVCLPPGAPGGREGGLLRALPHHQRKYAQVLHHCINRCH